MSKTKLTINPVTGKHDVVNRGKHIPMTGTDTNIAYDDEIVITSVEIVKLAATRYRMYFIGTGFLKLIDQIKYPDTATLGLGKTMQIEGADQTIYNGIRGTADDESDTSFFMTFALTDGHPVGFLTGPIVLSRVESMFGALAFIIAGTAGAATATTTSGNWQIHHSMAIGKRFKFSDEVGNGTPDIPLMICTVTGFGPNTAPSNVINFTVEDAGTFVTGLGTGNIHGAYLETQKPLRGNIIMENHPDDLKDFDDYTLIDNHMFVEHTRDSNNPHQVTQAGLGIPDVTNDKQIPIAGTIQLIDDFYPITIRAVIYDGAPTFAGYMYEITMPTFNGALPIGTPVIITGTDTFDGTATIFKVTILGDIDVIQLQKVAPANPQNSVGTTATGYYAWYNPTPSTNGSMNYNVPDDPILGNLKFTVQPDTLPGFDAFSTITEGRLQDQLALVAGATRTQTMSWASDTNPYVSSNTSLTYATQSRFEFSGSDLVGVPTKILALTSASSGVVNHSIRIYDVTNALVIAELTGQNDTIVSLEDLGVISNVPTGGATWEVQSKRDAAGAVNHRLHALTLEF